MTSSSSPTTDARRALRASLRARRRAVPPAQRANSARLVAECADRWLHLRPSWRVAVYAALPQELDATPLIELARARGCRVYLPVIDRHTLGRKMRFVELQKRSHPVKSPGTRHTASAVRQDAKFPGGPGQRINRLGIMEPEGARFIGARWLDVVFMPLLGFDTRGVRLGMGGGYYDRAFAFRRTRSAWHTPRLIGLAYSFQQVEGIAAEPHDVLLDAVVTDKGVVRCATG